MPSLFVVVILAAQLCAWAAATSKYDWVSDALPKCFEDCLGNTSDGCHSQKCICSASQSGAYLTSATECVRDKCQKKGLEISGVLLVPVQLYCGTVGSSIPDDVMSSAFACATGGTSPSTTTRKPASTSSAKQQSNSGLKSDVTSTFTLTSTDQDGHTLQIVQQIVMGPSTVSTGDAVTSTLDTASSSTSPASSSSAAALPSQTADASSAAPTAQSTPSSSTTPAATQRPANSNGSPFDNMQAGASQWRLSGPVIALGLLAGMFTTL